MPKGLGSKYRHRPAVMLCAALAAAALLAACATVPATGAALVPAPAQPSLQEWLQQAQSALKEGQRERSRQALRSAAKAYPTQKSPWQRLAEDYFDAGDYGNAILAAQEVLQRDEQDMLAHSVLAVSGLRLSTTSLVALRGRTSYPVGSREEAMGLARAMREALGETTLVPPRGGADASAAVARTTSTAVPTLHSAAAAPIPARTAPLPAASSPPAAARSTRRSAVAARPNPSTSAGVMPVVAPAPAAMPQAKPAADPFNLLK
jgi:hypothetical protein